MRYIFLLLVILQYLLLSNASAWENRVPKDYAEAKKIALNIFALHPETLYCGCEFNLDKKINMDSCSYKTHNSNKQDLKLEFEHMMPMENITKQLECGREAMCENSKGERFSGRKCCRKISPEYRAIEAELYNIWPVIAGMNRARSSFHYAVLPGLFYPKFRGCDFKIDTRNRLVEPRDAIKGIVARANLFMMDHYGIKLSASQRKLFLAWHKRFPPDAWEKEWAAIINNIEGYENKYITGYN